MTRAKHVSIMIEWENGYTDLKQYSSKDGAKVAVMGFQSYKEIPHEYQGKVFHVQTVQVFDLHVEFEGQS